jgi:hypothetical protein
MPRNHGLKCRSRILSPEKARRKQLEAEMIKRQNGSPTRKENVKKKKEKEKQHK